jgi:citronellol/citronellal dehydrogenase
MAKFGMSMCVLGMAGEFRGKVAVNALWPKTVIATSAVQNLLGGDEIVNQGRTPDIMADAAHAILTKDLSYTGHFDIDEDVLRAAGVTDFAKYSVVPGAQLMPDFFV